MVTDSGLWIKDEINEKKFIMKSKYIKGNFLTETIINEFNKDFELLKQFNPKIDIKENEWIIYQPKITNNNISNTINGTITLSTNFNEEKINNLSNISTLNLVELFSQKKFDKLGYSSDEIDIYLLKLFTMPLLYGILTILSAIIMFNFSKNKSQLFHVVIGILMSVLIYYLIFIFSSMGTNGKLPVYLSIFFPLMIISLISSIGLVNINDK